MRNHVKLGVSLKMLAMGLVDLWGIADLHCRKVESRKISVNELFVYGNHIKLEVSLHFWWIWPTVRPAHWYLGLYRDLTFASTIGVKMRPMSKDAKFHNV